MAGISSLPEPRDIQEIREIFQRHNERASNISPIITIGEALIEQFSNFTSREIDDIHRQLEIIGPWFPVSEERSELESIEQEFEVLRGKLASMVSDAKQGNITGLEEFDLETITNVFKMIDDVEKLWNKVRRWSLSLIRQGELFRRWLQEMIPTEG